jgi:glycine cleavage system regulatory protein
VALAVVVLEEQAAHKVMLELPIVVAVVGVDKIGLVEMVGLDALLFLFQQQTIQAQQLDLQLL